MFHVLLRLAHSGIQVEFQLKINKEMEIVPIGIQSNFR